MPQPLSYEFNGTNKTNETNNNPQSICLNSLTPSNSLTPKN